MYVAGESELHDQLLAEGRARRAMFYLRTEPQGKIGNESDVPVKKGRTFQEISATQAELPALLMIRSQSKLLA